MPEYGNGESIADVRIHTKLNCFNIRLGILCFSFFLAGILAMRFPSRELLNDSFPVDFGCIQIPSFAVDDSVGWPVQVGLTLFAFTPSQSLALAVNGQSVRQTCTSQPMDSSTANLKIPTGVNPQEGLQHNNGCQVLNPACILSTLQRIH